MLNLNFYNQIDDCTIREPLFVMSSDIYMTKKDEEVVKPTNPKFYKRFVDDIINKNKQDQPDLLFDNLNDHHPNIKYTIETMPQKFPDTKLIYEDNQIKTKYRKIRENLFIGHQRFQNVTSGILSILIFTEQYELRVFLLRKYQQINENF